jgi:endoglucanase
MAYNLKKKRQFQFYQRIFLLSLALFVFLSGFLTKISIPNLGSNAIPSFFGMEGFANANLVSIIQLPLSTQQARIVDSKGKTVILRGVNWFGMETETHAPHGLWKRDYKEMLSQIKDLGYNAIRLPYSVEAMRSPSANAIDYTIGSNKELEGKTPLEIMDAVIQEADRKGLWIILDSHRLSDKRIPELWYGDGFTEADWIDTWKMLAQRYKNQTNIIGADLKNEPHGKASWGTNNLATDWRLAAERAGNAILSINPDWLIIVEGIERNVPGQKLLNHWQGGNLEGVRRYPVRLSRRNKLVYSPHEYGPGVFNMPYFSEKSFPQNLYKRWETGFFYIHRQKIAPIWIGEFGGRQVDTKSIEGVWQNKLVKFIRDNNLSFAYWSWNPNSSDTGGILLDDWQSVDAPKQVLLSQILTVKFTPPSLVVANDGQSKPSPKLPQRVSNPLTSNQLKVTSHIYSNWQSGYCVSLKVSNSSSTKIQDWQLKFTMNQAAINNSWNANFKQQGNGEYIATPIDWAKTIDPNQTRDIGFCANKQGSDYQPQKVEIN